MKYNKAKVLIVTEGLKPESRIMNSLFSVYKLDAKHEIVHYGTDIYVLHDEMFINESPDDMDLLQVLKSREKNSDIKIMLEQKFTDILLIFDFDPQATTFEPKKIRSMTEHFTDSTDMGKLYINYPMIEAYYHMKSIPDASYNERTASLSELKVSNKDDGYKARVDKESCFRSKKALNRYECDEVLRQNIEKGWLISGGFSDTELPNCCLILDKQLERLDKEQVIHVLCTCIYYAVEYNSYYLPQLKA